MKLLHVSKLFLINATASTFLNPLNGVISSFRMKEEDKEKNVILRKCFILLICILKIELLKKVLRVMIIKYDVYTIVSAYDLFYKHEFIITLINLPA